jgi:hypothetical protein
MRKLGTIVILGTSLLAGCGTQGVSTTPRPPRPEPTAPAIGIPVPGVGGAQPGAGNVQQLMQTMARAHAELKSATSEVAMYCRGGVGTKPKGLPDLGGEWEVTTTYKMSYKKTERYRIDVTKCTNPNSVGMKMAVTGTQANVRLGGFLSMVPISRSLSDKDMLNFRGHRLDTGSLTGLARRLNNNDPQARLAGEMVLDGAALDVVEIPHAPSFDKTIAREVVGIDRATKLIRYHAMYTATRKVYELKFKALRPNAAVSDSQFSL